MKLSDLFERYTLNPGAANPLPPTFVMPELPNNDAYRQYRHLVALAAARAQSSLPLHSRLTDESAWGENQAVVCYTPEDLKTLELANKIMGVTHQALTKSPSQEDPRRNTTSPVRAFVDIQENLLADGKSARSGTIALLKPSKSTAITIKNWCDSNNLPCLDPNRIHCTVLYSQNTVPELSNLDGQPMVVKGQPKSLRVFKKSLAMELECPDAKVLHRWMVSKGGSHSHMEFIPHVTLSYDWTAPELPPVPVPSNMPVVFTRLQVDTINPSYMEEIKHYEDDEDVKHFFQRQS